MRSRHTATLAALTGLTGLTAMVALRRRADHRPSTPAAVPAPVTRRVPVSALLERDGVVLPFVRPVTAAAAAAAASLPPVPAHPARCGDTGGRTRSGSPCGARAGDGGRCHHHPIAA